jgi:N-acetylmuramoyl-L-alanine amidase
LNKKQDIFILFFFLLLSVAIPVSADNRAEDFVLVIDAGHGGKDPGALGKKSKEKDINLAVSTLVSNYISKEHPDVKIVYTRNKDTKIELKDRTNIANKANANLFISIHSNASSKQSVSGAEVYILGLHRTNENLSVAQRENSVILLEDNYQEKYKGYDPKLPEFRIIYELMQEKYMQQSLNFATMVQKELVRTAKRKNNGVKQAGFWVLVGASMPAILIELDYISNNDCEKFLASKTGQEKLARAIANAFSGYKKEWDAKKNRNPASYENTGKTDEAKVNNNPPETNKGIVYKVQILASAKKLPENSNQLKGYKAGYYVENNLYKYTYGESPDWNEIVRIRKSLLKDFNDAFIIKFENGIKKPVK